MKDHWGERSGQLRLRAQLLTPKPVAIRRNLKIGKYRTSPRLHAPLLGGLLEKYEMGRRAWRGQSIEGPPMLGNLGGPGVFLARPYAKEPIHREELFAEAKSSAKLGKKRPGKEASELSEEALARVGRK